MSDKAYDDLMGLTSAELFENLFEDMKTKVQVERDTGQAQKETVTTDRINLVRSQKAPQKLRAF